MKIPVLIAATILLFSSCSKKESGTENPSGRLTTKVFYNLADSTYTSVSSDPSGAGSSNTQTYPYSLRDSLIFDTSGSRKVVILRADTFEQKYVSASEANYTCLGDTKSFRIKDGGIGGMEVKLALRNDSLILSAYWHDRWTPKTFILRGVKG